MNYEEGSFTSKELTVLKALWQEELDCTGGDFGYLLDAKTDFSKYEFAGLVGSLTVKGVFDYLDTDYSNTYGGQFHLTDDTVNYLERL
jgi:hypothetical protein